MHYGLVRLVLEVAVPSGPEFFARPAVHHVKFFLGWSNLDTGLDTICRQWTSSIDIPLVEDLFLDLGIPSDKVIEGLDMWFGAEHGKGEIVIFRSSARVVHLVTVYVPWKLRPTPGRSIKGFTPALRSFSGSPIPDRWRISGELRVPPETMICLRALMTLD